MACFTCDGSQRLVPRSTFTGLGNMADFRQQPVRPLVPPCRQRPRPALVMLLRNPLPEGRPSGIGCDSTQQGIIFAAWALTTSSGEIYLRHAKCDRTDR